MEIYIIMYIVCCLIVLGFQLEKSESPFVNVDTQWLVISAVLVIFAPAVLPIIIGAKIHG